MNYKRVALAAVVAWLVDAVYGVVVWMVMLGDQPTKYPGVYRPEAAMNSHLPLMLAGGLVGMFALAYIYAKGYDGANGIAEGFRFGVVLAVFSVCFVSITAYATLNIGRRIAAYSAVASMVEMIVLGTVIGGVYRAVPLGQRARAAIL